jgi:hypothetical protein
VTIEPPEAGHDRAIAAEPLDALTPKQRELWQTMGMDAIRSEGAQTPEQAENLAVDSFLCACSLSDVEPPRRRCGRSCAVEREQVRPPLVRFS